MKQHITTNFAFDSTSAKVADFHFWVTFDHLWSEQHFSSSWVNYQNSHVAKTNKAYQGSNVDYNPCTLSLSLHFWWCTVWLSYLNAQHSEFYLLYSFRIFLRVFSTAKKLLSKLGILMPRTFLFIFCSYAPLFAKTCIGIITKLSLNWVFKPKTRLFFNPLVHNTLWILTSLTGISWFDFRLKASGNDQSVPKIVAHIQKWHENNYLTTCTKVQFKSLLHSSYLSSALAK